MNCIFLIAAADTPCDKTYSVFGEVFDSKRLEKSHLFPEIKHRLSLLGEFTARAVLGESRVVKAKSLQRIAGEFGKPFFKGFEDFYFNISHGGNFVAVAVADSAVGIDIEKIGKPNFNVAKRFNEKEKNYILQDLTQKTERFYEIWTKKEAFLKRSGKGISAPLSEFDVTEAIMEKQFYSFKENGFWVSACTRLSKKEFKIVRLSEAELLERYLQKTLLEAVEN